MKIVYVILILVCLIVVSHGARGRKRSRKRRKDPIITKRPDIGPKAQAGTISLGDIQIVTAPLIRPEVFKKTAPPIIEPAFVRPEIRKSKEPDQQEKVTDNPNNGNDEPDKVAVNNGTNSSDADIALTKAYVLKTEAVEININKEKEKDNEKDSEPETIKLQFTLIMYYVTPGILLLGIICQLIIAKLNSTYFFAYITQLWYSVADIMIVGAFLYALLSTPDQFTCKISWFVSMVAVGCLSMASFLMTLYKFILIKFPVGKREMTTIKKQVLWCLASFVLVAALSSPILWLGSLSENLGTARNFCYFKGDTYSYFIFSWIGVILVVPLLINIFMFVQIGIAVVSHKKKQEARKSRFLPTTQSTQVTTFSSVQNEPEDSEESEESANLLRKLSRTFSGPRNKKALQQVNSTEIQEGKTPRFPTIIIVSLAMTVMTTLPFIPAFINTGWFYSNSRIYLDILYGLMLLCLAISPFVHLLFSKKTKDTLVRIGLTLKNACVYICCICCKC